MSGFVSEVHRSFHWTAARKALLLDQIERGEISAEEAQTQHALSAEELEEWRRAARRGGEGFRARDQGRRNRERAAKFQASLT